MEAMAQSSHSRAPGHGGHDGHSHAISAEANTRMLTLALAINVAFMVAEVVAGILADSLALLSDAAHMLTDAGAIALALFAARLARRKAKGVMTFGLKRGEILSAQVNGLTLLVPAIFIVFEGISRLFHPPEVEAELVLWVGLAGLGANLAAACALARANRASLNVEGAFQHNLIDAFGSIAAAGAAAAILLFGFERADPIASLIVAALMLRSAYVLLKASGRILLEAAPEGMDPGEIGRALAAEPGVVEVHDLHVWEVTSGFPALSAHVVATPDAACHEVRFQLAEKLRAEFGIDHSTLQVEHEPERLLHLERPDP
ncbi:MAG TPA: cation diffusion facilitator family transporter [Solirubrobacterales bacterium]|nr:cation diffusion facilitator family transporter [Solirubrobacterales bacterium]